MFFFCKGHKNKRITLNQFKKYLFMKNFMLSILFLGSIQSYCQKSSGSITLIDGKVIQGFIRIGSDFFKFKENEDDEGIKYDWTKAVAATIIDRDNNELKYQFVYVENKDKPVILEVVIEDYLSLYALSATSYTANGGNYSNGGSFKDSKTYYVKKKDEKTAQFYTGFSYIPKISFKKFIETYFNDCPQIQEKVENKEFKKKDLEEIVSFYNKNCAPK